MNRIHINLYWLRIIGLLLFVWIVFQIEWRMVWALVKGLRLDYIAAYFAVFVVAVQLKVFRLQRVLKLFGYSVPFKDVYRSIVEPAFYGMVTPARLGEFSKVVYLGRFGLSNRQAWGVVLMERLVDFSVLLSASIAGLLLFFGGFAGESAVVVFLVLLLALYFAIGNFATLQAAAACLLQALPWKMPAVSEVLAMREGAARLGRAGAGVFLPTALIVLALSFWQLSLLGSALGASISGVYLGLAYSISTLIALLPISVGGVGTREAVYMIALGKVGVSKSLAVTISLLDGLVFGLVFLALLFIPLLVIQRNNPNRKESEENEICR